MKRCTENMRGAYDYEPLCAAILRRAVQDYKIAIKHKDFHAIASLERFFLSDYGQMLSRNQGQYIIDISREMARTKRSKQ